jgi:hypothetical protein
LPFSITELLSIVGLSSIISILLSSLVNWVSEEHRFKREQNIIYLKEKIDSFYSPMLFHFENMRSWSDAWSQESGYAYSGDALADKLGDMKELMRSGLRFTSTNVRALWYKWQPFAVAAVELRKGMTTYPWFSEEELQIRSKKLHMTIQAESERLTQEYEKSIKRPYGIE